MTAEGLLSFISFMSYRLAVFPESFADFADGFLRHRIFSHTGVRKLATFFVAYYPLPCQKNLNAVHPEVKK